MLLVQHWSTEKRRPSPAGESPPLMVDGKQFGLIIAYLLPGFLALAGVAPIVPAVGEWLRPVNQSGVGMGPPIYALVLALTLGLFSGCVRWLIIDHLMLLLQVPRSAKKYSKLPDTLAVVDYLVENHYRFYQFYSASLVSILWTYVLNRLFHTLPLLGGGTDLAVLILSAILLLAARDSLKKYREKLSTVLSPIAE